MFAVCVFHRCQLHDVNFCFWLGFLVIGPSDTTTKLVDNVEEHIGIRSPRTIAASRDFSILAVGYHRSNQMLSAIKNLPRCSSLYRFRHAANERYSMTKSLLRLIKDLRDDHKKQVQLSSTVDRSAVTFVIPLNTPPRRRPTRGNNEDELEIVDWAPRLSAGFTPCRGRSVTDEHREREKQCSGAVLLYRIDEPGPASDPKKGRGACRLCGSTTNFYCTGCKNYLCCGSQAVSDTRIPKILSKLEEDAIDDAPVSAPKKTIKIPFYDPKEEAWKYMFANNVCYLIQHKSAFNVKEWM